MCRGFPCHVIHHLSLDRFASQITRSGAEKRFIPRRQPPGVVISLATNHHPVQLTQLSRHLFTGDDTAVDTNSQLRKITLQTVHQFVAQRRHLPVLLWREALEPGIARMHDKGMAACLADSTDKVTHKFVAFILVNANAVLHGNRHAHHIHHGLHTVCHQTRLSHQTSTKRAALHTLTWATAIEVDFNVAPLLTESRAVGEVGRLAAPQLQRHRVFFGIKTQVSLHVAVN